MAWRGSISRSLMSTVRASSLRSSPAVPRARPPPLAAPPLQSRRLSFTNPRSRPEILISLIYPIYLFYVLAEMVGGWVLEIVFSDTGCWKSWRLCFLLLLVIIERRFLVFFSITKWKCHIPNTIPFYTFAVIAGALHALIFFRLLQEFGRIRLRAIASAAEQCGGCSPTDFASQYQCAGLLWAVPWYLLPYLSGSLVVYLWVFSV